MPRNYSKYNSTRSEAAFVQKAFESLLLVSNATAACPTLAAGQVSGWASASTDVTCSLVAGNDHGDASDWGSVGTGPEGIGGSIILAKGTYRVELNQLVTLGDANGGHLHWALTDDSFNLIHESNVAVPHVMTVNGETTAITSVTQFTLTEETALRYHILMEIISTSTAGTLGRGDFGQIKIYKVK